MEKDIDFSTRFQELEGVELQYPMTPENFPKGPSRLHSPQKYSNPEGLKEPIHFGDEGFNEILWEAVGVALDVKNQVYPAEFLKRHHPDPDFDPYEMPIPLQMKGLSINEPMSCAYAVRMDRPEDCSIAWVDYLNGHREENLEGETVGRDGGACELAANDDELPLTGHTEFLARYPRMSKIASAACDENLQKSFNAKNNFGLMRPPIAAEKLTGIPASSWRLYPHPPHPAYPAGHSSSNAMNKLKPLWKLTKEDIKQGFNTAYHWGMFRTFPLMHYAQDNIAGLIISGILKYDDSELGYTFGDGWDYTKM